MKKLLFLLMLIGSTIHAQSWIDGQCELISDIKLTDFKDANEQDGLQLIIDQEKKLKADGKDVSFLDDVQRKEYFYNFIMNPDDQDDMAKKPTKAVIRVESYGHKEAKKRLIGQLRDVYYIIWTEAAMDRYDKEYVELDCQKREKVQKKYPYQVIENVEKQKKKDNNKPPTPMTAPSFKGDVKDN